MLNDKVLPFHKQHDLPMLRILTDRGTGYCGRADRHDYQLFLAINDIKYTKTKVKSPQTNGNCQIEFELLHGLSVFGCQTSIVLVAT